MNRGHYYNARTGSSQPPSLVSDPLPAFIYKKMARHWALKFVEEGSVLIGSLLYYRTFEDESGTIADPNEGLAAAEVTEELAAGSMLTMLAKGNPPVAGSALRNEDNRRLVFCAAESPSVPPEALDPEYDTWVQIEAKPALGLIHQELLKRVPGVDEPVFKKVIYDPAIDGPDHSPPFRTFWELLNHALGLDGRWFTKRTRFQAQREVRVGWLADPTVCVSPIVLAVCGLQSFAKILE